MSNMLLYNSIILLVKSAIDGTAVKLPDGIEFNELFKLANEQQLLTLVYYGIENSNIEIPDDMRKTIEDKLLQYVIADQIQAKSLSSVLAAFEENGIDHMPVKGMLLKKNYPLSEMRLMGDGDILIKTSQKDEIFSLMKEMGYEFATESPHEFVFSKKGVCVELHKCLIPPYNKDYYQYYEDGWKFANISNGFKHLHEMKKEDHFVYIFTHFSKHYRDGGIGVQHLVDFWVYCRDVKPDFGYIRKELDKLSLAEFFDNIMATVDVWFNNADTTEMSEFITKRIFSSGVFGNEESKHLATTLRTSGHNEAKNAKNKYVLRTYFPDLNDMQNRYPVLKKHKYLLPVMWVARFFDVLLFKRDRLYNKLDEIKHISEDKISSYQKELDYVGLDFNNKE